MSGHGRSNRSTSPGPAYDIGRVPLRVSSGFAGFAAEQWTIFYLFALKDIIPSNIITFGTCLFKQLYGAEKCTMNMHFHEHLAECIKDFEPVYSFWCFAYERIDEWCTKSIQYMRRFLDSKSYAPIYWLSEFVAR